MQYGAHLLRSFTLTEMVSKWCFLDDNTISTMADSKGTQHKNLTETRVSAV